MFKFPQWAAGEDETQQFVYTTILDDGTWISKRNKSVGGEMQHARVEVEGLI
jgi:hypothetical protein